MFVLVLISLLLEITGMRSLGHRVYSKSFEDLLLKFSREAFSWPMKCMFPMDPLTGGSTFNVE
jgi:hypothetical protein